MKRRAAAAIPSAAIPLTPLIDIVFLLLLYFMLTANLAADRSLAIATPASTTAGPAERAAVTLSVDARGAIRFEGKPVTEEELAGRLAAARAASPEVAALVRADRALPLERLVRLLDLVRGAGIFRLSLATRAAD